MNNWETEEKKGTSSDIARKILLAMIIMLVVLIVVIIGLLLTIQSNTFKIIIDGKTVQNTNTLLQNVENTTYINIQELATLLGYEYHVGEYKVFSSDEDKCYIQSANETASFYLNSNKICKLPVNELTQDYEVFASEKNMIQIQNQFYAPIDAIKIGFNISITETENKMTITTLNQLLKNINTSLNGSEENDKTTYKSFLEGDFNNQKAALYNYVIFCKNSSGLYGIMTTQGQEILPDKYKSIAFSESTQEFLVTNSLDKMGIVDATGKNKIEQNYDSIKIINNNPKLYLVSIGQKYGVLGETGNHIIYPEYDSIGVDPTIYQTLLNQYVLLDNVIPVCQNQKFGAFDIQGKKIIDIIYDGIGYEQNTIQLKETTKPVNPVVAIQECNGIVVKAGENYGVMNATTGKELVPIRTDGIYSITSAGEEIYYMVYQNNESNLIQQLINRGLIKKSTETIEEEQQANQTVNNTTINNTTATQNSVLYYHQATQPNTTHQ